MQNEIENRIKEIKFDISEAKAKYRNSSDEISIMAVTKTVSATDINIAVNAGITLLGENRVQEFLSKKDDYDEKSSVHFIGKLQSNKVKYIINEVDMIHSVDNIKLLEQIDKYSKNNDKIMDILIEVNIGAEASKSGVLPDRLSDFIYETAEYKNVRVRGLMAIPPVENVESHFYEMNKLFCDAKSHKIDGNYNMEILSMGMSKDYILAVKYGSNIVRIGSKIFGNRKI